MSKRTEPLSDEQLMTAGHELWKRYHGDLWANIPAGARILIAYANPGAAWRAR